MSITSCVTSRHHSKFIFQTIRASTVPAAAIDQAAVTPSTTLGDLERKQHEVKIPGINVSVERRMGFWFIAVTDIARLLLLLGISNAMHIVPLPRAEECDWILLYPSKLAVSLTTLILAA